MKNGDLVYVIRPTDKRFLGQTGRLIGVNHCHDLMTVQFLKFWTVCKIGELQPVITS